MDSPSSPASKPTPTDAAAPPAADAARPNAPDAAASADAAAPAAGAVVAPKPAGAVVAPAIEGLVLLTPLDAVTAELGERGWKHNARPPATVDQRIVVFPTAGATSGATAGAKRLELIVESSTLVGLTATYAAGNPALRELFTSLELQAEQPDGWYAGDKAHQVLAFVSKDNTQVRVLAAGQLRDQREVARMFQTFLKDPP